MIESPIPPLIQLDESSLRLGFAALRKVDPKEAKAALEAATSYLAQLSLSPKTLWNEHSIPISTLPEELLSLILTEVVDVLMEDTKGNWKRNTQRSWKRRVEISSVCKTWRAASLDYPSYWAGTRLHLRCPGIVNMLPRWKNHPRRVAIDLDAHELKSDPHLPKHLSDLFAPGHLADVQVYSSYPAQLAALWDALPKGWNSTVEILHIYSQPTYTPGGRAPLPPHVLPGAGHTLRHLILEFCPVDWKALEALGSQVNAAFGKLRTLRLTGLKPPPSTVLNAILSASQELEILMIRHSFPRAFEPAFQSPKSSRLVNLHLEDHFTPVLKTYLWMTSTSSFDSLRHLALFATDNIGVTPAPPLPDPFLPMVNEVFTRFSAYANGIHGLEGCRLLVEHEPRFFSVAVRDAKPWQYSKQNMLWVGSTTLPLFVEFPLVELCNVSEVGGLSLAVVEGERFASHPREAWLRFLERHSKVKVLQLKGLHRGDAQRMKDFVLLLSPSHLAGTVLLPKLRKLQIGATELLSQNGILGIIEVMLLSRGESGFPIAVVEFDSDCSGLGSNALLKLRERFQGHGTRFVEGEY